MTTTDFTSIDLDGLVCVTGGARKKSESDRALIGWLNKQSGAKLFKLERGNSDPAQEP